MAFITYERVLNYIADAPMTFLPALLIAVTEAAMKKRCFKTGGASKTVARIERRFSKSRKREPVPEDKVLTCGKCHAEYRLTADSIHRSCGLNYCSGTLHAL